VPAADLGNIGNIYGSGATPQHLAPPGSRYRYIEKYEAADTSSMPIKFDPWSDSTRLSFSNSVSDTPLPVNQTLFNTPSSAQVRSARACSARLWQPASSSCQPEEYKRGAPSLRAHAQSRVLAHPEFPLGTPESSLQLNYARMCQIMQVTPIDGCVRLSSSSAGYGVLGANTSFAAYSLILTARVSPRCTVSRANRSTCACASSCRIFCEHEAGEKSQDAGLLCPLQL
jgi:hypothetical protein